MSEISIPLSWLRQYAKDNGGETEEIIDYMIKEYLKEINTRK